MTTRQDMYTRDELRGLYAKVQGEERLKQVDQIVTQISDHTVRQAKGNPATTFIYALPQHCQLKEFYMTNMSDIVTGLLACFPDSTITQRHILRTRDGKDHDISTLDPKFISLLGHGERMEAIMIDWS